LPPPAYQPPPSPSGGYRAGLAPSRLTVVNSGAAVALPNAIQAVIGRADPVSQFFPDVDLTPHGALDNGVGRRHVRIFVSGGQVMVEDLDSTNGTLLNGVRLTARQPQPLHQGDQLTLGKLAMSYSEY
jgi:pSer/pThr/pTyr-binding forkhead associated (FHA) protein